MSIEKYVKAFEKQKELKVWLKKRIDFNQRRLDWQNKHLNEPYGQEVADAIEQRIFDYNEILEMIK